MTQVHAIDLSRLTAPDVVEALDFERIVSAMKADFVARFPDFTADLESDPAIKVLEVAAYRELVLRARVNDAAKAVLLAHAGGSDLDHLAALVGTARREIAEATDTEPAVLESDDELRARAQLAWEALSVAGPEGAYLYHALAADGRVRDARVDSPTPGTVVVTLLARDGDGSAPDDLVDAVQAYLSAEDRRPLTDTVVVDGATIVPWRLEAVLHCYPGPASAPVIEAAHQAAEATVARLHALGHDVTRSALFAALHRPGVQRVDLTSPAADIVVAPAEAPHCTAIVITEGARDV
ncbi:baseplate assembly protein [Roseospira visakhapatnamensis]|uniref:Phage-related baseplate assembly protein n=1 Tax=Roseospira visakhapatnamensis TaxID=390880 RepID=A0A7W6RF29_9PROT|nr:baseplate J/gp47 family protein [Roseospira visakhapatnamensis]MBB4267356.1 phage-related baseplate assembly protein [Roseospira visakhapatnamensis]